MKSSRLQQIAMLTKYTFYVMLLICMSFQWIQASDTQAQSTKSVRDVFITVDFDRTPLRDVFDKIEKKTNYKFAYNLEDISTEIQVTRKFRNVSVAEVLFEISKVANLKFKQVNQNINVNQINRSGKLQEEVLEILLQTRNITGTITSFEDEDTLPGVNVVEKGTTNGTVTDVDGKFSLTVNEGATIVFSSVGFTPEEVLVGNRSVIDLAMTQDITQLQELVVVGYGTQKKSDITGSVASISESRLDMVPNTDFTQAIQGSIPGVIINTNSGGASPDNTSILIRGRNSIRASNNPLIVVDGIAYSGQLGDINPNDIQSIEILKDASSAAIYGSRGANGVILVTTKQGESGKPKINYDGFYSMQKMIEFPEFMNGEEFYNFKLERDAATMTLTEEEIYQNREWVDWPAIALRDGRSQQHNLSVSGGSENTKYFISGTLLDVKGLAQNDNYQRITNRINLESSITDWLSIGTRTTFTYADQSGLSPSFGDLTFMSPLTRAFNNDGSLTIYPNEENPNQANPLQGTLANNIDESYQLVTNNFIDVELPFVEGLSYRLNTGFRFKFTDDATYYGRNTRTGLEDRGNANTNRSKFTNTVVENIMNYNRDFGRHGIFITALYSFEEYENTSNSLRATGFPHDILEWYSARQAELLLPSYGYSKTDLISQMLRINYTFDDRYLLTITGRRDGYSGFGSRKKWGQFPSFAVGWNIANEQFFSYDNVINNLKLRLSWGENGNQAVGAYETISRLSSSDYVTGPTTLPGYVPSKLGEDNLGWESTETFNLGLDFGLFDDRISGDINYYQSNTTDLLLNRSISAVHGISTVTQNIGQTRNQGLEVSVNSHNLRAGELKWTTQANASTFRNEIVSLYGFLDDDGNEIDDIANRWFIDQPVRVNYNFMVDGVWQLDEQDQAQLYGSEPGFVKIRDVNNDTTIDAQDRIIIGQRDPKFLWGMTNTFEYKNFIFSFFIHGVHGVTKFNPLKNDEVWTDITRNTIKKNWWTPDNPTNEFYANKIDAERQGGGSAAYYENASFLRLKDITLAYNLPQAILDNIGLNRLRIYMTGRNLATISNWGGMDPELDGQRAIPLQKEYVFGLNIGL